MRKYELKWIPVSERLPEEEMKVLVCSDTDDMEICGGSMSTEMPGEWIWYTSGWRFGDVVAWMPLPEPYRNVPSAEPERIIKIGQRSGKTLESAINYLHSVGWLQEHDRILTESAEPERMAKVIDTWKVAGSDELNAWCPECEHRITRGCQFCPTCGVKLDWGERDEQKNRC